MIHFTDIYRKDDNALLPGAAEFLYELLIERPSEANISHSRTVRYVDHLVYVKSYPYRHWFIVQDGKAWVGSLSAGYENSIGIAIKAEYRRKGFARKALEQFLKNYDPLPSVLGRRPGYFVANIAPNNEASLKLFRGLGGILIQHTFRMS